MTNKVVVILPAHNEEADIGRVVGYLKKIKREGGIKDFVVVANGCTDRTAEIAIKLGANVIQTREANKGKAFLLGLPFARERKAGIVVTVDADAAEFTSKNIRALTDPIGKGKAKMVVSEFGHHSGSISYPPEYSGFRAISMDTLKPIFAGNKTWIDALTSTSYSLERGLNTKILGNPRVDKETLGHIPSMRRKVGSPLGQNAFLGSENLLGSMKKGERERLVIVNAGFKVNRDIRVPQQIVKMNSITSGYFIDRVRKLKEILEERRGIVSRQARKVSVRK
ncbi:MAG: glycosyltransferase [archaeon]|jgi:glycosyltransferase involved in cell wall biosynthesis